MRATREFVLHTSPCLVLRCCAQQGLERGGWASARLPVAPIQPRGSCNRTGADPASLTPFLLASRPPISLPSFQKVINCTSGPEKPGTERLQAEPLMERGGAGRGGRRTGWARCRPQTAQGHSLVMSLGPPERARAQAPEAKGARPCRLSQAAEASHVLHAGGHAPPGQAAGPPTVPQSPGWVSAKREAQVC